MPYTGPGDESLPPNIKELPENDRARWANIWNSVYAECQDSGGEDCEGQAFKQANGSLKDNADKKGPGRGWWGPQKGGTHGGGAGGQSGPDLSAYMDQRNIDDITLGPDGGLYQAKDDMGFDYLRQLIIDPIGKRITVGLDKTHGDVIARYQDSGQDYRNSLRATISYRGRDSDRASIMFQVDRLASDIGVSDSEAWDRVWSSAMLLKQTGFPDSTEIRFSYWRDSSKTTAYPLGDIR